MTRLRRALVGAVVLLVLAGTALASWVATGTGTGAGKADAVPAGDAPAVVVTGRNVAISWSAASFDDGTDVTGYRVARYLDGTGTPGTVGASCAGTLTALTCTERTVPPGDWRYTITPVHQDWTGSEGPLSPIAAVGTPSFSFASAATITSLPTTRAGSLSDFGTGETVTFRLDAETGPALSGSTVPDPIPFAGAATTSVTIPAGTSDGIHEIFAVGSDGSVASSVVTIDTTAPVVSEAVIGKSQGGRPGFVKQGGTYHVYANVTDPTSGVATVSANVSTVTTGSTGVALTSGTWTVAGTSYGYRSALLTASNPWRPERRPSRSRRPTPSGTPARPGGSRSPWTTRARAPRTYRSRTVAPRWASRRPATSSPSRTAKRWSRCRSSPAGTAPPSPLR